MSRASQDAPRLAAAILRSRSLASLSLSRLRSSASCAVTRPEAELDARDDLVLPLHCTRPTYQPTGDGKWAAIDPADIGAMAVKALTQPGHEGKAYTLTGPESLSAAQYAAILSRVLGRPVRFVDVPPEAARDSLRQSGMPEAYVDAVLDLLAFMKANKADGVFGVETMEKGLGRKAGTFEAWARRHAAAFR